MYLSIYTHLMVSIEKKEQATLADSNVAKYTDKIVVFYRICCFCLQNYRD